MYGSGYYPAGAWDDPYAPYNEPCDCDYDYDVELLCFLPGDEDGHGVTEYITVSVQAYLGSPPTESDIYDAIATYYKEHLDAESGGPYEDYDVVSYEPL